MLRTELNDLTQVSRSCKHLLNLHLEMAGKIDDLAVQETVCNLKSLTSLNIGACHEVLT